LSKIKNIYLGFGATKITNSGVGTVVKVVSNLPVLETLKLCFKQSSMDDKAVDNLG